MSRDDGGQRHDAPRRGRILDFRTGRPRSLGDASAEASPYDAAFDRAWQRLASLRALVDEQRRRADDLIEHLLQVSPEQQELLIQNSSAFHSWGLVERLIEESRAAAPRFAGGLSQRCARAAILVTEKLEPAIYGTGHLADLRAAAQASLGNSYRAAGDYEAPAEAFGSARSLLARGTGDPTVEAQLSSFESSWLITRGRWQEAADVVDRTLRVLPTGLQQLRCELLAIKGYALWPIRPDDSVASYRKAVADLPPGANGRLAYSVHQGSLVAQCSVGHDARLADRLRNAERLLPRHGGTEALTLLWTRGFVALRLGEPTAASQAFRGVWRTTRLHRSLELDFPLISLDLVTALAAAGSAVQAQRLCRQVGQALEERSRRPAVVRGWRRLTTALAAGTLAPHTLDAYRRFLWRAWSDPRAELVLPA